MSVDSFKAQAHRLQGYLRSNPDAAARLSEGKQSACYEAVAALHGARNWNTLCAGVTAPPEVPEVEFFCASPSGLSTAPPELPPLECFGEIRVGSTVSHLAGWSRVALSADLIHALTDGYRVTLVSAQKEFHHLALAVEGDAGEVEDFCKHPVEGHPMLSLEFRGPAARPVPWFDIPAGGGAASAQRLTRLLQQRGGRGSILVLENAPAVLWNAQEGSLAFVETLRAFSASGASLVLTASTLAELKGLKVLQEVLPPTSVVVAARTAHP